MDLMYSSMNFAFSNIGINFSFNSGSKLGRGSGMDAYKARKSIFLDEKPLKQWEEKRDNIAKKAQLAKFIQNKNLKDMLFATWSASLIYFNPHKDEKKPKEEKKD